MSRSRSLKDSSLDEAHERSIPPKLRIGLVCSPIGNSEDPELLSCPFWDQRFDFLEGVAFSSVELGEAFADTRDEGATLNLFLSVTAKIRFWGGG